MSLCGKTKWHMKKHVVYRHFIVLKNGDWLEPVLPTFNFYLFRHISLIRSNVVRESPGRPGRFICNLHLWMVQMGRFLWCIWLFMLKVRACIKTSSCIEWLLDQSLADWLQLRFWTMWWTQQTLCRDVSNIVKIALKIKMLIVIVIAIRLPTTLCMNSCWAGGITSQTLHLLTCRKQRCGVFFFWMCLLFLV